MPKETFRIEGVGTLDISQINSSINKIQSTLSKIKLEPNLATDFTRLFNELQTEAQKFQNQLENGFKTKGDVTGLERTASRIENIFNQLTKDFNKVGTLDFSKVLKIDSSLQNKINGIDEEIKDLNNSLKSITDDNLQSVVNSLNKLQTTGAKKASLNILENFKSGDIQEAIDLIDQLIKKQKQYQKQLTTTGRTTTNVDANKRALEELKDTMEEVLKSTQELNQKISDLDADKVKELSQASENLSNDFNEANQNVQNLRNGVSSFTTEATSAASAQQRFNEEVSEVKNNIANFFSLANGVELFRDAVRSAFETVKELDAAMTETAVVTDYSVSDMWNELPRYTETANKLGATTLGAYETMTLFYQQGLDTNEAFEIGTETMKMARIAGLDYANATDLMTAALRGFNMELNEVSAKRVNDVYSELAAVTASDTEEIGVAMSKTASIAASANMEFETTAAFLAQIIETTREAPETAGTAMKTIIARFTEVKELFDQGQLIGEDSEGQEININKIDEALKTVDISLKDFLTGAKGLDDILLELAGKWDSLDLATQRYIATTAAGSRQQSRFLAMMSNYDRTMELVDAAYNSTGASQQQFDKTLESLEAKLNKLSNAWNAFTMGLADSDLIKGAVDMLTALLTGVNNLADALGPVGGTITRFLAAFLGFKIGKNVLTNLFSSFTSTFSKTGDSFEREGEKAGRKLGKGIKEGAEDSVDDLDLSASLQKAVDKIKNVKLTQSGLSDFSKQFGKLEDNFEIFASRANSIFDPLKDLGDDIKPTIKSIGDTLRNNLLLQLEAIDITGDEALTGLRNSIRQLGNETSLDEFKNDIKQINNELVTLRQNGRNIDLSINTSTIKTMNKQLGSTSQIIAQTQMGFNSLGSLLSQLGGTVGKFGSELLGISSIIDNIIDLGQSAYGVFNIIKNGATIAGIAISSLIAPIAAVGAALAILGGIAWASHYYSEGETLKRQLKEAQEATEAATQAAEDAQVAYDNVISAFDSYNTAQNALEELTQGTLEWKEALIDVNQQVLDLIAKYPELAQYVTTGESGQLQISQEGQDTYIAQKQQSITATTTAELSAQVIETQAQLANDRYNLQQQLNNPQYFGNTNLDEVLDLYQSRPEAFVTQEFEAQDLVDATNEQIISLFEQNVIPMAKAQNIQTGLEDYLNFDEFGNYTGVKRGYEQLVANELRNSESIVNNLLTSIAEAEDLTIYSDQLWEFSNGVKSTAQSLVDMSSDFAEFSTASLEAESTVQGLIDTMLKTTVDKTVLQDEFGNTLTEVFSNIASDQMSEEINERAKQLNQQNDLSQLQELYAATFEIPEDQINEKIREDEEALANAIASFEISDEYSSKIEEVFRNISQTTSESAEDFFNIMANNAEKIESTDLSAISDMGIDKYLESVAKELGYVTEQGAVEIEAFAEDLGISIEELTQQFSNSISFIENQQKETQKGLVESMIGTGLYNNSQEILSVIEQMTSEQQSQMSSALENLQPLGEQATNVAWQIMPELATNADTFNEAQSLINSLDFSNPINSAYQLSVAADSTNAKVRELANGLMEAGYESLNSGEQFSYFLSSADFTDINEQLDGFIDENGKISARNIEELAKDNASLNKMLAQGKVNANGLAKALNSIKLGNIDPSGFTDRVLEAISAITSTDEVLSHMHETIANFDPGIDSGEGIDFLTQSYEKMQEYANNFEYGNQQFQNYISQIFGADAVAQALASENPEIAFNGYLTKLKTWVAGDGYGFWNQVGLGDIVLDGIAAQLDSEGNVILGYINSETGEFVDSVNLTTEEMIQSIADGAGVTYETAEMLLANFMSHSTDLVKQLGKNDFEAAIDELLTPLHNLGTESEGLWVISEQELAAFATSMGKTVDEAYAMVQEKAKEKNGTVKVVNWFSDDGVQLMGKDLLDEIMSQLGVDGVMELLAKLNIDTTDGVVELDELKAAFSELGLNEEQMNSAIDAVAQYANLTLSQEVEVPVKGTMANGEQGVVIDKVTVTADSMSGLTSAINSTLEAADYNLVAEAIVEQDYSKLGDSIEDVMSKAATNAASDLRNKVNGISFANKTIKITPILTDNDVDIRVNKVVTTTTVNRTINNRPIFSQYASGTGPRGFAGQGRSLVGEEGQELVQTEDGQAYLVGTEGPEIVRLNQGDIVYSNQQTQNILTPRNHLRIERYATGKWNQSNKNQVTGGGSSGGSSNKGSSSSSGSSSAGNTAEEVTEEEEIWENTYDWLYNLTEDINEALRERERIERRYDQILKDRSSTSQDLLQNVYDQLDALQKQYDLEEQMFNKRKEEMQRYLKENQNLSKYATFNWNDQTIEINWDAINKVADVDTGERIEEYISKLEFIQEEMEAANDNLNDIKDSMEELEDIGKEDFLDFEQRVMDAVIGHYQDQIDELSLIDQSINDANSKLMNSIRNSVDQMRQQRENEQTEESLAEKERRLAFLRQDTSGGNQLEIKQLEEEIANERQSYGDSLVDQKLQEFENQNNLASEQRQQQIELAQAALDMAQETGDLWKNVQELIKTGVSNSGKLITGSQLDLILKKQESWYGLSNTAKMDWLKDIEEALKISSSYYDKEKQDIYGVSYDPNTDYNRLILNMLESGNIDYHQLAIWEQQRNAKIIAEGLDYPLRFEYVDYLSEYNPNIDYMARINEYLAQGNYLMAAISQLQRNRKIDELGLDWEKEYDLLPYLITGNNNNPLLDYSDYVIDWGEYHPERPLSSNYTRDYSYLMSTDMSTYGNSNYYQSSGDNYYEIHIDVESLSSDYDVDQIADKVKRQINEDARYRNVNAINRLR